MSISERVQLTLADSIAELNSNPEFIKLREFYKEMQEAGIAKKPTYTLPPQDTAGLQIYQQAPPRKTP